MRSFPKIAGEKLPKNIPTEIRKAIEEISRKIGEHPVQDSTASEHSKEDYRDNVLTIEILNEVALPEIRYFFASNYV